MSFHVSYNLDELSAERFQELCNYLLLHHFSELITPMVRPGRDGQMDGFSDCEPLNYSDLLRRPFSYRAPDGTNSLWVFQCKFTKHDRSTDRVKAALRALKKEIETWREKRPKPTHYIFLTNVNLPKSAIDQAKKSGKAAFGYFDLWHEPKISLFVAADVALQRTFFPLRFAAVDFSLLDLKLTTSSSPSRRARARRRPATSAEPKEAIAQLVQYEMAFTRATMAFVEQLKITTAQREFPKEWKRTTLKARSSGLLRLAKDKKALSWLIGKIVSNEIQVLIWNCYPGERVDRGEEVATLVHSPELEKAVARQLGSIFEYVGGDNTAHTSVDQYLKSLESRILTDLKDNRIQESTDSLRQFLQARTTYASLKKDVPEAFYPNLRRWGRLPVFGWDFNDLWEKILTNIYDLAFKGDFPESLLQFLVYLPFHLCIQAVNERRSLESLRTELSTLRLVFWQVDRRDLKEQKAQFLSKLEDLVQAIEDLQLNAGDNVEPQWAVEVASEVARYIADLGQVTLSGRASLPFDALVELLRRATSLRLDKMLDDSEPEKWSERRELQVQLEGKLRLTRQGWLYAWATYSWNRERQSGSFNPAVPISLLAQVTMAEVVQFYNLKTDNGGWLRSWFQPVGKHVSWSWSLDHDVRDSLQLAILTQPIKAEDFEDLDLFQVESAYSDFIRDLESVREQLVSKGISVAEWHAVAAVLAEARKRQAEKFKSLIREQKTFDPKKLAIITESFQSEMARETPEGLIYVVSDDLERSGRQPTHSVGQYVIFDKVWFLADTGTSGYSINSLGTNWADGILSGREHLLVETARTLAAKKEFIACDLASTLKQIRDSYSEDYVLVMSYRTVPWMLSAELFTNEQAILNSGGSSVSGRQGSLGKIDLHYSRYLEEGEFLLLRRGGFHWKVKARCVAPSVRLIDENSNEGRQIASNNPDMDVTLKALVWAREDGVMEYGAELEAPVLFQPIDQPAK